MAESTKIAIFKGKQVRRVIYQNEWWFVVEDVVLALVDSNDPKQYVQRMKLRDLELAKGWVQIVHTLLVETFGGKQKMNCADTEGIFRIIQSITSPKAEPFKRWLARVGYERVKDMNDFQLIFTMLGERSTTEIHRVEDSRGLPKLKKDAHAGGNIAGGARKQLEKRLRRSIVSKKNFLPRRK